MFGFSLLILVLLIEVNSSLLTKYYSNHSRQSGASLSYHTILGEFEIDFLRTFLNG